LRRFYLHRVLDETGTSGVGVVAEGVEFSDGSICLRWLSETPSFVLYTSAEDVLKVHGHGGNTEIFWRD
jgi:hypothetical protein